jgi:hypothetical protein
MIRKVQALSMQKLDCGLKQPDQAIPEPEETV